MPYCGMWESWPTYHLRGSRCFNYVNLSKEVSFGNHLSLLTHVVSKRYKLNPSSKRGWPWVLPDLASLHPFLDGTLGHITSFLIPVFKVSNISISLLLLLIFNNIIFFFKERMPILLSKPWMISEPHAAVFGGLILRTQSSLIRADKEKASHVLFQVRWQGMAR